MARPEVRKFFLVTKKRFQPFYLKSNLNPVMQPFNHILRRHDGLLPGEKSGAGGRKQMGVLRNNGMLLIQLQRAYECLAKL